MKKISALLSLILVIALLSTPTVYATSTTATVEFTAGILSLVSAPNLSFGTKTMGTDVSPYAAVTVSGPLVVSDLRGTGVGWSVTATLTAFENSGSPSLSGASITLPAGTPTTTSGSIAVAPTPSAQTLVSADGVQHKVISAAAASGQGVWNNAFAPANTFLNVYGNEQAGVNTASITWTANIAP